jgi:hypothetical protein
MTLASLNVEKFMTKVSMQNGGFRGAIQLGNAAGFNGSVRDFKLELSHSVRRKAMRQAPRKRIDGESLVLGVLGLSRFCPVDRPKTARLAGA